MLHIIHSSINNTKISNSAAAAITLANIHNPSFCGINLRNINIPNAIL